MEKVHVHGWYESTPRSPCVSDYLPCFQALIQYRIIYLVIICWHRHTYIFNVNIFNICMRYIWFNATFILTNFYRTTLLYDRVIGTTLCYQKWALIWSFISVCSIINEHEFISDLVVAVKFFIIFTYIIFINFWLL